MSNLQRKVCISVASCSSDKKKTTGRTPAKKTFKFDAEHQYIN